MASYVLISIAGIVYVQFLEWFLHKYVLHGALLGKKPYSLLGFHWRSHHRSARITKFYDKDYESWPRWDASGKELAALLFLALIHVPVYYISSVFFYTLISGAFTYYIVHRYSHLHPEWAMKWLPWHFDHHMGTNQDANWGVTTPLFDYLFATRIKYQYTKEWKVKK